MPPYIHYVEPYFGRGETEVLGVTFRNSGLYWTRRAPGEQGRLVRPDPPDLVERILPKSHLDDDRRFVVGDR